MKKSNRVAALRMLALSLPALTIFLFGIYLRVYPIEYEVKTNIMDINDAINPRPLGLFFLTNYLNVSTPVENYNSYLELSIHIISLFILLYVIWLPLIMKGFFRDRILDKWTILLLVGSFGPLVTPFCSLLYWNHWMFMLVYPFTFYATNGLEKVLKKVEPKKTWLNFSKIAIAITVIIGILFMILPTNLAIFGIPTTTSYFPSSMQQNTIPLEDVKGTIKCIKWLNTNMNQNSVVIVHHAFLYWTKLYLDNNHTIIYYAMNLTKAVEVAQQNGFKEIYLIWWSQNIGWYPDISIPRTFKLTYTQSRISAYALEKV
jgi:hypothetical protein